MPAYRDLGYVLNKLGWMRAERIWPNGLSYTWTDAFGVVLLVSFYAELGEPLPRRGGMGGVRGRLSKKNLPTADLRRALHSSIKRNQSHEQNHTPTASQNNFFSSLLDAAGMLRVCRQRRSGFSFHAQGQIVASFPNTPLKRSFW